MRGYRSVEISIRMAFTPRSPSCSLGAYLTWIVNVGRLQELLVRLVVTNASHMESLSRKVEFCGCPHGKVPPLPSSGEMEPVCTHDLVYCKPLQSSALITNMHCRISPSA